VARSRSVKTGDLGECGHLHKFSKNARAGRESAVRAVCDLVLAWCDVSQFVPSFWTPAHSRAFCRSANARIWVASPLRRVKTSAKRVSFHFVLSLSLARA
jgi:hypothetical protein